MYSFLYLMEVLFIANVRENPINEQIRCREMMVIGPNGEQLGIKSKQDALTLAGYAGFDLVLMSEGANPPVCKIMDYNKFKYEKKKKIKETQKKQRETMVDTKEFRLSVTIDKHDFDTRVKNARKNLEKAENRVDYIITYDVGFKLRSMLKMESNCFNNLHAYLNEVAADCKFKTWFFGCFHIDKRIPPIYHAVYRNIYEIESGKEI